MGRVLCDASSVCLLNNNNNEELQQKLNTIISGSKKIIIGFLPEYYTYIDDSEYGLQLGGGYMNSSYISLKPYNNIYAYIFDENYFLFQHHLLHLLPDL